MVEGRVCTRDTLTECAAMTTARNALTQSYQTYRFGPVLRAAQGGARPSVGPLPGLPVSQRPLQEDLSRFAENLPSCVRDVVGKG